jgi:hypothetical protein
MTDTNVAMEMPKYNCHKQVWALKIERINDVVENEEGIGASLCFYDDGYGALDVSDKFMGRHKPEVGGYYVLYKDGYESYSPADAFEAGYTLDA